jgi:ComF family protein
MKNECEFFPHVDAGEVFLHLVPMKHTIAALLRAVIDTVLPPLCPGTGEIVDRRGMVSATFWPQLSFIEAPMCATCGAPFSFESPLGSLCARCIDEEPAFDRARAAVTYNDASRALVLGFKYGDKMHAVHTFVPWLKRAGQELIEEADVLVPVPLHPRRLWRRRFNQSALLAAELGKACGKTCVPDGLLRLRATVPQQGLSRKDRAKNVKNAFTANEKRALSGKKVLLIDDIFTSGATLNACARALKKAGAEKVFVLTIARVTREEF